MKTKAKRRHRLSALVAVLCIAAILAPFAGLTAFADVDWFDLLSEKISGDYGYTVLSEADKTCEIVDYSGSAAELNIPSQLDGYTVVSIGWQAFGGCTSLTQVTIPDSVTSIGDGAFVNTGYYNTASNWVDGVLYLDNCLLDVEPDEISSQYSILPDTRVIAHSAFENCTNLTQVRIPDSVTNIGDGAFENCYNLTQVTIPDSVTSIGVHAFGNCHSLTEITIPNSVLSIGDYAFSGTGYYYTASNWVDGVLYLDNCLLAVKPDEIPSQYSILPDTRVIADQAFEFCDRLMEIEVDSKNTAYSSKDGVLFNKAQTELIQYPAGKQDKGYTIPQGVTNIGDWAFYDCDNLTQVAIPASVTNIEDNAFAYCDSLTEVTIPQGVTSIGDSAFDGCISLTEITIPTSVTRIGDYAFDGCIILTEITIPASVTSIGNCAFNDCDNLTQVTISASVTSIGSRAFCGCTNLTQVMIPDSVTRIGWEVFLASGLTTVYGYKGSYAESYAEENGYTFIPLIELSDAKSGIIVAATDVNVFPENAELAVSVVDTANDRITYDISLQAGGKEIRPNGSVTVKIPVPETMDGANVKVYRQEADGTLTDMHATFQDGYAVFTTDHFSRYILESKTESVQPTDPAKPTDPTQPTQPTDPANPQPGQSGTTQAPANNAHTDIPKTGSASNALAGTCAFMLAIAAVGALGLKKAYRKKKAQA